MWQGEGVDGPDPLERFAELAARVDALFQRIHDRHRVRMQCSSGCTDCCQPGLSVTPVEAVAIAVGLLGEPAGRRAQLAALAGRPGSDRCAALDPGGRCSIYEWRPLVCRSHGAPIRRREPGALPVIDACPRNFGDGVEVDGDDVIDQETVSTVLAAVDAAFADEQGLPRGQRIDLAALLADPGAFLEVEE